MKSSKLIFALGGYLLFALLAYFTLDGDMRLAVWVLMGGLSLKTLVASEKLRAQHAADAGERRGPDEVNNHRENH